MRENALNSSINSDERGEAMQVCKHVQTSGKRRELACNCDTHTSAVRLASVGELVWVAMENAKGISATKAGQPTGNLHPGNSWRRRTPKL